MSALRLWKKQLKGEHGGGVSTSCSSGPCSGATDGLYIVRVIIVVAEESLLSTAVNDKVAQSVARTRRWKRRLELSGHRVTAVNGRRRVVHIDQSMGAVL